jgi:hypothetical protein
MLLRKGKSLEMLLNFFSLGVTQRHDSSTLDRRSEFENSSGYQPEVLRPTSAGVGPEIKLAACSCSVEKMPYRWRANMTLTLRRDMNGTAGNGR